MFNPLRLSIARRRRQLTKKALAEKSGIAQLTVTRLEQHTPYQPEQSTIQAIATALKYPFEFFYLPDCEELSVEHVSFRSMSTLTARQRDAALAAGTIAFDIDNWVSNKFNLPDLDLIDLQHEKPAVAAQALRAYWGIGFKPIPNMVRLLEAKGIRVFSLSEPHKNVDAYACWRSRNNKAYIFLNTFKSTERSRWDAAHELGHLVMHRHSLGHADRNVEVEANEFASAFLMPREDLLPNLRVRRSLNDFIFAKARWGVSVAALTRTAYDSGLITEWLYRELCQQISASGYRTKEPQSRPAERSVVWQKVFESLWRDGFSRNHLVSSLCLPLDELDAVVGGVYGSTVERLQPRQTPLLKIVK